MDNLNNTEFYEMMIYSLFLNYGKNISKDIDIFYIGSSNSRTSALMFKIVARLKNNSQDIHIFSKVTNLGLSRNIRNLTKTYLLYPTIMEIKFFKLCSLLKDKNICDNFVYCYNDKVLQNRDVHIYDSEVYSILLTEDIGDALTLKEYLKKNNVFYKSVLWQIIYTLGIMQIINMRHMDLHLMNIYIQKVKAGYELYTYYDNNEFKTIYVYNNGLKVKFIDLDGAIKLKPSMNNVISEFTSDIKNPSVFSGIGNTTNPRINIMKVMWGLARKDIKLKNNTIMNFKKYGFINENKEVPWFSKRKPVALNKKLSATGKIIKPDVKLLKRYGILMTQNALNLKENRDILNFGNEVIYDPLTIMKTFGSHFPIHANRFGYDIIGKYNMKNLFNKE